MMASVGLPSIVLWQGMQRRANRLPMLMHDALRDDSKLARQRVNTRLSQLAALAHFVQARRFSLYCRECNKLLSLYVQQESRRTILAPLLLGAAVRAAQSLAGPLQCLIDSADLDQLRQARGASAVEQIRLGSCAAWAVPKLKALLRKQLMHAHYTLGLSAIDSELHPAPGAPNNFSILNRVAALSLGGVLLESVENAKCNQQTCQQILRLELCCHGVSECAPPRTFSAMQKRFVKVSTQQLLRGLRRRMRVLLGQAEQQQGLNLEHSMRAFHEINANCVLLGSCPVQTVNRISVSAQRLALHLRCWGQSDAEAGTLLCLCALALERQLDIAIATQQRRRVCERTDRRLRRKVEHFIRTHRRRMRALYAVPVSSVRAQAREELCGIHRQLRKHCMLYKSAQTAVLVEDELFHALIRFKAIALYMGEMALYEFLWNFRELTVLAIERKLQLSKMLVGLLPRLSAFCLRVLIIERRTLGYDTRLINALGEVLRAQRQVSLFKIVPRDNKIRLPARKGPGNKGDTRSITTAQLPIFLAKNIRSLIADPVAIYRCQSAGQFADLSREMVLELTVLVRGARALQVDRVAALSEVLLEIYRSLNTLSVLPEREVLKHNLQAAHRCMRLALNQAAARQKVCDVRPIIVSLYHFLERLHRAPPDSPDSLQAALCAVNALAADMRAFADVFASVSTHRPDSRVLLAQEQLQGLLATTRRMQEDLAVTGQVNIARWGPPLRYKVGRFSNELAKPVRLALLFDEIAVARELVLGLQSPLACLLCLMIEHSVEGVARRRAAGKPDSAGLSVRASCRDAMLTVHLEDDGAGLEQYQIGSVAKEISALGGVLSLAGEAGSGSLVSVTIPCASARWDIASKSL